MITDALLLLLGVIVDAIVAAIHAIGWTVTLPASVSAFISLMLSYDDLLPVSEILAVAGCTFSYSTSTWIFKFIKQIADWIVGVIP